MLVVSSWYLLTPWEMQNSPENAISSVICLPSPQDGNVARQSSLHQVRLAIELPRLARLARLQDLARLVHTDRYLSLLNKSVLLDVSIMPLWVL